MRELNSQELAIVSGGTELICTIGLFQLTCTGTVGAWDNFFMGVADSTFSLYDAAVESTTDLFEYLFGENPEEDAP